MLKMETLEDLKVTNYQNVSDAYSGRTIFVTGGTGFLGKVFIEKILYSCPKISKIYVLIREQRNATVEERVKTMTSSPLFNRLREERPVDLNKIVPISGDIVLANLGLKPEDEETLVNEVSMVFHVAASVRFNEHLQKALKINFIGTKNVLELSQRIRKIEAFIHISTAFSNPNLEFIKEVLYPPLISMEEAEQFAKGSIISNEESLKILGNSYNTYTFAKGLAENYVAKYHGHIPTAIIRPSIVAASNTEPVVGWIDNWSGATGILVAIAQGLDRTMLSDSNHFIDLIPVDFVVNGTIVAATKLKRSTDVAVYNICSSSENPITIGDVIHMSSKNCVKYKFNSVPFPMAVLTLSKWKVNIITYFQKLCAMLIDFVLYFVGLQPRCAKFQSMILRARNLAEPFTQRSWMISAENTRALFESLSDSDQKCFNFNPRNIIWMEYLSNYMQGVKKYLYKINND